MRLKLFSSMIKKNVTWFDSNKHAPGMLTNILSQDVLLLSGLTAESVGIFCEAIFGISLSVFICFCFSWQLGFVAGILSPLTFLGGIAVYKL